MKLLAGCVVSAGLVFASFSANAQLLSPQMLGAYGAAQSRYQTVSDFEEPYGGVPPALPPYGAAPPYGAPPAYGPPGAYGYEPALMPPREVYAVLRDNGFLPLGIPHRAGYAYEIAAMDPAGEDGRLLIDGRNGRILRFVPASPWGGPHASQLTGPYGAHAALPPPTTVRGLRPPAPIPNITSRDLARRDAGRAVPLPAPKPAETAAVQPRPQPQISAAAPQPAAPTVEAKPQPVVKPTQDMPPVQGLD